MKRDYWYSNLLGGFSSINGNAPPSDKYKFIGTFNKEVNINSNMVLIKCTDTETQQKEFKNPFHKSKRVFCKKDIKLLFESMDELDNIVIYGSRTN